MVSFLEGVKNANKAINCFLLGAGGNILGGIASLPGGSPEFVENTTKALRRLAGCDPDDDPPLPPGAFTGGQCAVPYRIIVAVRNGATGEPDPNSPFNVGTRTGPLELTNNTPAPTFCVAPNMGWPSREIRPVSGLQTPIQLVNAACSNFDRFVGVTLERVDGLPDDCGGPSPIFPPATPTNIDIDVTYNIDDGTEVTVTIPFIYAPITTDISGNFRIPFTFDFGGVEFSGNVSLEPNFNVTINPPPAPRGTDSPLTDLPDPDDEIPVTPSTFAERVVGVVVQSALVGEQQLTTIFTTDIPQILVPRCGSVKFGYAIAGRSFWSPDIDIKDLNCFIPCPFSQGADTVAASPAPGVVLNYVPIFGAPLATVADLGQTVE